jgi:hypothetical protein
MKNSRQLLRLNISESLEQTRADEIGEPPRPFLICCETYQFDENVKDYGRLMANLGA